MVAFAAFVAAFVECAAVAAFVADAAWQLFAPSALGVAAFPREKVVVAAEEVRG